MPRAARSELWKEVSRRNMVCATSRHRLESRDQRSGRHSGTLAATWPHGCIEGTDYVEDEGLNTLKALIQTPLWSSLQCSQVTAASLSPHHSWAALDSAL